MRINIRILLFTFICLNSLKVTFSQDTINITVPKTDSIYDVNGKLYKRIRSIDSINQIISYYDLNGDWMENINVNQFTDEYTSDIIVNNIKQRLHKTDCWYRYIFFSFIVTDSTINNVRILGHNFKNYTNNELTDIVTISIMTLKDFKWNCNYPTLKEFCFTSYTECSVIREKKSLGYKKEQ